MSCCRVGGRNLLHHLPLCRCALLGNWRYEAAVSRLLTRIARTRLRADDAMKITADYRLAWPGQAKR
jgi:hypothetical protein